MIHKTSIHPSKKTIIFEEDRHLYYTSDNPDRFFTSGTTFLHHFTETFDKDRISKSYAKKHNLNQSDVLEQWETKARVSRENGTQVHATLENLFLGKTVMISKDNDRVAAMQKSGIQLFSDLQSKYKLIEAEKIVADLQNRIAGMVDLIGIKQDGTIVILDYKTNEKITYENNFQTLKYPVNHLQDTSFNQYTLQLNIYQNIMISQGYFPQNTPYERFILHIRPDGYEIIECPDRQFDVSKMLEHFKTQTISHQAT